MPRSKKPRKKYRPMVVNVLPGENPARKKKAVMAAMQFAALANSSEIDYSDATAIVNRTRAAYEALKCGSSDTKDYDRVGWALNVAYVRAADIDERLCDILAVVADVLLAARARFDQLGRFGFRGDELQAMNRGMEIYEEILRNSSPRQMHEADDAVERSLVALRRKQESQGHAPRP